MRTSPPVRGLLLLALLCAPVTAQADKVDDYLNDAIKRRNIPGISVAVVQDGKPVVLKGYGLANVELKVPATKETVYQLASVTKQFTATAIMMLVEEGKLSLDAPVTSLLSGLPTTWEPVTLRHLLNHTSGIFSYTSLPDFFANGNTRRDYAPEALIKLVADRPLEFAPGEKFRYNNTGYFLLGMIIEKVSGKTYGEFLRERIFQPLGMTATRVNDHREIIPNRATGYTRGPKGLRNAEYVSPTQPFSAGALVSTVEDMAKWDAALASGKLLKKATLEQMWTPTQLKDGKTEEYGFGWALGRLNGHRQISHGGGIPGFSTEILRLPDDKLTVVALCNSDAANAGALARGVAALYIPALAEVPKSAEAVKDDNPELTKKLKGVLLDAMKGEANPELFTPEAQKQLIPRLKEGKEMLAGFGALKSFTLLEKRGQAGGIGRRYHAVFANKTAQISYFLTSEGKIAGLRLLPE